MQDRDFEIERAWLLLKDDLGTLDSEKPLEDRISGGEETLMTNLDAQFEEGGGVECGCCFSPASFVCFPRWQDFNPQTNPTQA